MIDIKKEIEKKFPKVDLESSFLKKSLLKLAQKLIHENSINNFLNENSHLKGLSFVDAVLDYFDFDYKVSSNDLENIPSSGKVIIIANHPLGGLDALCLLKLVSSVRKDVKIVASDLLLGIKQLESILIPINNYKKRQKKESILNIYQALKNEEVLIIFPAGEVSRVSAKGIQDGTWSKGFLSFAKHSNAPILPIHINAKNSKFFYTLSIINKTFSTLLLSNEMFNKKSKNIDIKIGEIIPNESLKTKSLKDKTLVSLFKKHLYALKKGKNSYFFTQKAIIRAQNPKYIYKELKKSQILGSTQDGKKIFLYKCIGDSIVLKELGRLREETFRKVGEGLNQKKDTDRYDIHYEHIILWDEDNLEIVGSYRIGKGDFIIKNIGIKAFYSNTLFSYNKELIPFLEHSIELGRSFVQSKYWGTRALDYLWYGIGAYLNKNPQIKYMFGPLSLSANFPNIAKDLIIFYYSHYYTIKESYVEARLPYVYASDVNSIKEFFVLNDKKEDFKILKNTLNTFACSVPILYKQYAELCKDTGISFHAFNVDKKFSSCIDAFIFVEVDKIKDKQKRRYIK